MIGLGTDYWRYSLFISVQELQNLNINSGFYLFNFEFTKYIRKIPLILTLYFIFIFSIFFYWIRTFFLYLRINLSWMNSLFFFLNRKYLFFTKNIIYPLIDLMNYSSLNFTFKLFDKGLIELFGPYGIVKVTSYFINSVSKIQTGLIYHYSGFIILGLIFYIFVLI